MLAGDIVDVGEQVRNWEAVEEHGEESRSGVGVRGQGYQDPVSG